MARKDSKDRGLFERTVDSGDYWIRYAGNDGREHMERGGTKSEGRALYMRRRTEIHDGTWKSPRERRAVRRKAIEHSTADEPLTLGAFADAWLEERTPHLTKAVHYDYKLLLNSHVHGHELARKPIAEVNDRVISLLVKDLTEHQTRRKKPLSPRRINMAIARLQTIFATGHRRKLIVDDPMPHVANLANPSTTWTHSTSLRHCASSMPQKVGNALFLACCSSPACGRMKRSRHRGTRSTLSMG